MNTSISIKREHAKSWDIYKNIKKEIDNSIKQNKNERWHYESRLKQLDSYTLKLCTGRLDAISDIDDFLAATIVVENAKEIEKAVKLVQKYTIISKRLPKTPKFTLKEPESFVFDDIRLYVRLKPNNKFPSEHVINLYQHYKFEIQIKTYLQHAWSIATHDLVYKNDEVNWAKKRIAYQVKAMLEHAEVTIADIESIKESEILPKDNRETRKLKQVHKFLVENWEKDLLPSDLIRLSENVLRLVSLLKIELNQLKSIIELETNLGRGAKTIHLCPYLAIIQSIVNQQPQILDDFFSDSTSSDKIVVTSEINFNSVSVNKNKLIKL